MDRLFDQPRKMRTAAALPVKVTLQPGNRTVIACTLDVSNQGARLNAIQADLKEGDLLLIQHKNIKARYRVVWVGNEKQKTRGQVGVLCLDAGKHIWQENPFEAERSIMRIRRA